MGKKSKSQVKAKSSWKTVKLDEGLLARGIPQELVGIEELRDYKLVKRNFRKSIKQPVPTSSELESDKVLVKSGSQNDNDEDSAHQETEQRPAKKKKIKSKKSTVEKKKRQTKESNDEQTKGKLDVEDSSALVVEEVCKFLFVD